MRGLRITLVLLLVLAGLGVGAEFLLRDQVQKTALDALSGSAFKPVKPTVDLAPSPLLVALAQGKLVDVSGTAERVSVPVDGRSVPVREVTYRASDIRVLGPKEAVIGRLNVGGTLHWSDIGTVNGLTLSSAGEGRVKVTYQGSVAGVDLRVTASALPVLDVDNQQVRFDQAKVEVAGVPLDERMSQQILAQVVRPIPLDPAEGFRVTALSANDQGLAATLTALDFTVKR